MKTCNVRATARVMVVGVLAGAATLLGCEDAEEAKPAKIVAEDAVMKVNPTTVQALEGQTFTFASGAALDPKLADQPLTLTFTETSKTTPTFTFTSPALGGTDGKPASATGSTTFGSCIFTVVGHTYQAGQAGVSIGQTIKVDPCSVKATTKGLKADKIPTSTQILLQLGLSTSGPKSATIAIDDQGNIVLNGTNAGERVRLEVTTGSEGK